MQSKAERFPNTYLNQIKKRIYDTIYVNQITSRDDNRIY